MTQNFKAECKYFHNYSITMEDMKSICESNSSLTGKVVDINVSKRKLTVMLGEYLYGEMPWEEVTVCNLTNNVSDKTNVPDQITSIMRRKVRVKVIDILDNGKILLSRKANMIEAWNNMLNLPDDYVFDAAVTGIHKYGSVVFYDIGEGITGFCHVHEFNSTKVELNKWIKYGHLHQVVRYGQPDYERFSFNCSRKRACKKNYENFSKYQIVNVRVAEPIHENGKITGYFVEVNPLVCGIADPPYDGRELKYGDFAQACIRKVSVEKRKMSLDIL